MSTRSSTTASSCLVARSPHPRRPRSSSISSRLAAPPTTRGGSNSELSMTCRSWSRPSPTQCARHSMRSPAQGSGIWPPTGGSLGAFRGPSSRSGTSTATGSPPRLVRGASAHADLPVARRRARRRANAARPRKPSPGRPSSGEPRTGWDPRRPNCYDRSRGGHRRRRGASDGHGRRRLHLPPVPRSFIQPGWGEETARHLQRVRSRTSANRHLPPRNPSRFGDRECSCVVPPPASRGSAIPSRFEPEARAPSGRRTELEAPRFASRRWSQHRDRWGTDDDAFAIGHAMVIDGGQTA